MRAANPVARLSVWLAVSFVAHGIALVLGVGLAGITVLEVWSLLGCQPHISDSLACRWRWNVAVGLALAVCGLVFGCIQGLILRYQRVIHVSVWIAVTTVGWTIGLMAGYSLYMASRSDLMRWIAFGVAGLVPGLAQWFVLKRSQPQAGWWVLVNTISAILFGLAIQLQGIGFAILMIISLTLTGSAFVWLTRSSASEKETLAAGD